ncbi:MAG TPA: sigma-70 family RNA polymerase sigma factor [Rhizobium sp.]|nr:sigma-70 family RNA polymerase sigma factor [Rhizobium sp.]
MSARTREEQWAEWMRAAIAGDSRAYQSFLTGVTPHLRALALNGCDRFGAPKGDAEDVVQEVLLAVHLKRGTWDPDRPIGPWLSAIVRNKLIDALRRRGRRTSVPIADVTDILTANETADGTTDLGDAERLIARLRPPQDEIVRLSLAGKDAREMAGRLDMSEGAVRVALHRALKTLAKLYRSDTDEDD